MIFCFFELLSLDKLYYINNQYETCHHLSSFCRRRRWCRQCGHSGSPRFRIHPHRKLGRAIANLIYSVEEIPLGIINWTSREGDYAGFSVGIVDGTATMFERMGYGIYELVTFWAPTYKCTYKPPYQGRCGMSGLKEYNPNGGLSEFPAELSFQSYYKYSRQQRD